MRDPNIEGPWGAFALAVAAAAMTTATLMVAGIWLGGGGYVVPPLPFLFVAVVIIAAPIIAVAAAFIGMPLSWLLARGRMEAPWSYPAAGLIGGAIVLVGLDRLGMADSWRSPAESLQIASLGAASGAVCGLCWWLLYRRQFQAERGG